MAKNNNGKKQKQNPQKGQQDAAQNPNSSDNPKYQNGKSKNSNSPDYI